MAALSKGYCDLKAKCSPDPSQPEDLGPTLAPYPTLNTTEPSRTQWVRAKLSTLAPHSKHMAKESLL